MKSERGQALILIALGMAALLALTALAIDGGMAFAERRSSQNAADNAALAAAYSMLANKDQTLAISAAETITSSNGFSEDNSVFDIQFANVPSDVCDGQGVDITVSLGTSTETSFGGIVGVDNVDSTVAAVTRACFSHNAPLFLGNAVVGLDPNGRSFETTSKSAKWEIRGGGIFTNNEAYNQNSTIDFVDGHCTTAVGAVTGNNKFSCYTENNAIFELTYPDDIIPMLPRIPACDGVAYRGKDGRLHPQNGADGSVVDHFEDNYAPGLYCITDAGGNLHGTTTGSDVTFYISDTNFTMKFNGGGTMNVQAPTTGEYAGVLMFSGITSKPCTQNLEFRGNGSSENIGTIFLPSACIDGRGNSTQKQNRTQIIGYKISSNGTGDIFISYNPEDNYTEPKPPVIELLE